MAAATMTADDSQVTSRTVPIAKQPAPTHVAAVAIDKAYRKGDMKVPVLRGVDLCVSHGEFLAIVGQSGCGKSTLLHLLGLLDGPDVGEVRLKGKRIDDLPTSTRDELRNRVFGFVFQFYHLLPELTLLENVMTPMMIRHSAWEFWKRRTEFKEQAEEIVRKVGLEHRRRHKPSELSGGEMQRAAIARSLVGKPQILLADEPTGNLDASTGGEIMDVLARLNADEGLTIIMVTHDDRLAHEASRIVRLSEGRIQRLEDAA